MFKNNVCRSVCEVKMKVHVGTSGWIYDWNTDGSLNWYIKYSGLNAVELNASFYRFPYPNQVVSWFRKGAKLKWSIKVNRVITHIRRLNIKALETWRKFQRLFKPMDSIVRFYLFQMPPTFVKNERNIERIRFFAKETGLKDRLAIEFRHESWFNEETVSELRKLGLTIVSVDSPQTTWIASSNGIIYLRMHGRIIWYAYDYSEEELNEIANQIVKVDAKEVYIFFNNNHWMLNNARYMLKILKERLS